MSFVNEGFLSSDVEKFRLQMREKYSEYFSLAETINAQAQLLKNSIDVPNSDGQALIVFGLYSRILETHASVVRLSEVGLGTDAEAIARVGIEALFKLKHSADSWQFAKNFIESDYLNRRKYINVAASNPDSWLREVLKFGTDKFNETRRLLENNIKISKVVEHKIERLAKDAGLDDVYNGAYRYLSDAVHTGVRKIDRFYTWSDETGKPLRLNLDPDEEPICHVLRTSMNTVWGAILFSWEYFEINDHGFIKEIMNQLAALRVPANEHRT